MKKVAEKNQKKNDHRCIAAPVKIGTQNVHSIFSQLCGNFGIFSGELGV